jgi:hypothetical protein
VQKSKLSFNSSELLVKNAETRERTQQPLAGQPENLQDDKIFSRIAKNSAGRVVAGISTDKRNLKG